MLDEIAAGRLQPVYVVVSPEPLLLDRAATAIRDAAVPPAARAFNADVLDGKGCTAARVLAAAQTLPMLADRRLVEVRDAGAMPAAELAKLVDYLERPNESTVLLMTAAKVDKRVKFFATAKKRKFLVDLQPPRNPAPWLRDEARRRGVRISAAAAARLVDVVGNDLSRLALSLDQLALYAGDRPVEVDDVDDLIAHTREQTVFELTDAIGRGDAPAAWAALHALCDQRQSAIGVVMMLARHVRGLAAARRAADRRTPRAKLAATLGVPPFVADKLVAQASRFSLAALDRALEQLHAADVALKGGRPALKTLGRDLGERIVLDRAVADLLAAGRGAAAAPRARRR
ncbi:MAG: DNA polymerase III subunit delta [Deltaproteobacteria bacterium]|nr:MAG: DNA polymerase III subunit delta [Deltaproteobacteria bacterium]